ncbi:MAG: HIT family protein [Proteobacteria bacterium]|nr:HIT family protein [Pseudomonadota bacterium]
MNCVFCRILNNELPGSRVMEDARTIAFLDIHPVAEGHTLVMPRRHVESFTDLSPEEVSALFSSGQLIATHLKTVLKNCEGITLSLADGVSAGQEVPHVHLHLIPRKQGDGFGWKFPPNYSDDPTERSVLGEVASRIKRSLEGQHVDSKG